MGNKIDRREFLSLMGLGGAAAVTLSCGDSPNFDEVWHPWVEPVEGTIPYIPNFYATTTHESDGLGLRVRTIEGRATLVHGNPEHPFSFGDADGVGTITARQQSVVEDLYGPGRIKMPRSKDGTELTWREAGKLLSEKLNAAQGKNISALTGAFTGATAEMWTRFVGEMGNGKVVQYKAYAESAMLLASEKVFGQQSVPLVSLAGADLVVSLGAQFLETWGNVTDNMKHYGDLRTPDHGKRGKHVQVEARCSGTGANADELIQAKPGSETLIALALLKAVSGKLGGADKAKVDALTGNASLESAASAAGVKAELLQHVADELSHAKHAVVLPAENLALGKDAVVHHAAVLLINKALGGIGKHFNYAAGKPIERVPNHQGILDLVSDLNSGSVEVLVIKGTNPAYNLNADVKFAEAVGKAGFTIAFADKMDETTALADLVIPVTHDLESWGEVNTYTGIDMLMQPVMRPRWNIKQAEDHLIDWINQLKPGTIAEANFRDVLQASWTSRFGADWRGALKKGGSFNVAEGSDLPISGNLGSDFFASAKANTVSGPALVIVDSPRFGDGFAANRGWMQELPDTMTGVTWDSWLEVSPENAKSMGVDYGDVVKVSANGQFVEVPVMIAETISNDVVTLGTGQGHNAFSEEYNRGANAFAFLSSDLNDAGTFYAGPHKADIAKTGKSRKMATPHVPGWGDRIVTTLHKMDGNWGEDNDHYKRDLFQSVSIGELDGHHGKGHGLYAAHVDAAYEDESIRFPRHKDRLAETYHGFYPNRDDDKVYQDRDETFYDPYKWELGIDLNRCTGCGSCVTACYGENNLPVVGRDQVIKGREMSWVRINRYLSFTEKDGHKKVGVHMMPMMCQQCGNAPCESVCPSLATYHNKEGLNAMVYNRCVGTRYCSNNCSYKVRRFNWFSWTFPGDMKWQMNPAVGVRQKGVMEKCTFCTQRIREGKSVAKDKGRLVQDGEIKTACQEACPTQAITFGNVKEEGSVISKTNHDHRAYKALDSHIHTKPGVTYLKRVVLGDTGNSHG